MKHYKSDKGLLSDYDEDLRYRLILENYRTGEARELPVYGMNADQNYKVITPTQQKAINKRRENERRHNPDEENFVWFVFEAASALTDIVPEEYMAGTEKGNEYKE